MFSIEIPKDRITLERQIEALKYALEHDTSTKDKQIHSEALERLERKCNAI